MAEIDGGGLSFVSEMNNDKLDAAINETMRRIQGFSDAVVGSGDVFDSTSQRMLDDARNMLTQIGAACQTHEQELAQLEAKYDELGKQMSDAYTHGRDAEYNAINQTRKELMGEIRTRKQVLSQLREQSNALEAEAEKMEKAKAETDKVANAHESLRTKIRNLKEEMADLRANGIDENSKAYKDLANELGRLQDIQGDIAKQGSVLANDEANFAGVMSGLQGVVGGFTAAQGAVALFAGENEDLQKVMLKVQSLMSITMGLQQASQALNKDSAFSLVTLTKAKEWWNNLLDVGRGKQIAETEATIANTTAQVAHATAQGTDATATTTDTIATKANTAAQAQNTVATGTNAAAQGVQTATAVAGTAANIGLAGAFRMVGAAMKSIPVFGWILAGISAVIALVSHFTSKAREAKKAQEEWYKSVAENVYKPVAAITDLQTRWNALGDDFKAKEKFVKDNKKAFDELGVSVKGVTDAENLLSSPAQVKKFIDAQIKKAEAMIYMQQATEKVKTLMENRQKEKSMSDTKAVTYVGTGGYAMTAQVRNTEKDKLKAENDALEQEIRDGFKNAANAEKEGMSILQNAGMEATEEYAKGSLGAIEQAIHLKQEALKHLTNNDEYKKALEEINQLQAQADKITGTKKTGAGGGDSSSKKDAFLERLSKYKAEYARFQKWVNSGDSVLVQSANKEFASLLQQGATYIDYLKKQRDIILSVDVANRTKAQNTQLRQLNDAIAEETKKTVLEAFNNELSDQLANAKTVLEMLNVIEARRKELANDGTDLDNGKKETLDNAEKSAKEQMQKETDELLKEYESYMAKRKAIDEKYTNDMALLQARRATAMSDAERTEIDAAIKNRQAQYTDDSKTSGNVDYDRMLSEYGTFEQRKQAIIEEYEKKRRVAQEMGDTDMLTELNKKQAAAIASLNFEELKLDPDYIRAFEDLDFTSTETLQHLVDKFEEAKTALAVSTNPADLKEYTDAITKMVDEINSRDLFGTLHRGYVELRNASNELEAAEQNLANVRANGGKGTDREVAAIARVNKAKDNYLRKNKEVRKSEKDVEKQIDELCKGLSDLGKEIGGEAGEIISLIGDIGSFVLQTADAVKATAATGAQAISTIEKASIILAVISAAYQIASKIVSIFSDDDGTAAYEAATKVYKAYIDTINDVIDAELALMDTMTGKDASQKLEYAISLMNKATEAARTLGKQYLDAGASKGFLGIGSKSSHGVSQRNDITAEAWKQAREVANAYAIDWESISQGRMTGLFDLTVEQIRALKKEAPLFFAQLHEDTREYLNNIVEEADKMDEIFAKFNETITGVSWDTMRDDFISALQDMELSAESISKNIQDYLRKALIMDMFKRLYQDKLEDYYKKFAESLNADSENGTEISANERSALDTMREAIVNGAVAATEKINEQFADIMSSGADASLTGAVKGVTEETASVVAGQINAVRINQLEATAILRQQLQTLNTIAANTAFNRYLVKLDRIVALLERSSSDSSLRSQGLT